MIKLMDDSDLFRQNLPINELFDKFMERHDPEQMKKKFKEQQEKGIFDRKA